MSELGPVSVPGDSGVALGDAVGFMTEFNANVQIFGQVMTMLQGFVAAMSAIPGMTEYATYDPYEAAGLRDPETGEQMPGPLPLLDEPVNPIVQIYEDVSGMKTMLEEAGLDAGEEEDGMTVFDAAVENAVRRAMGMDEVAEKPEWMPDFLWGMGQDLFGQSLTEKPEDMSDEEWAALTGAWDTGQKAFGVDENPLEQMQMDVDDLKTTVPGMAEDITRVDTTAVSAQGTANEAKGTANSALSAASQALSAAEEAKRIAESAQAAAAAAGGTRPGADSPGVDRPPGAGGYR